MKTNHSFSDFQKETAGMRIGRMSFAGALRRSLGDSNAVQWYYHTKVPELKNITPHEYVAQQGENGKQRLSSEIYYLLTGQPD